MTPDLQNVPIAICVPCWRDEIGDTFQALAALDDPRRMIVRDGDRLIVHRRHMIDPHVIAAGCGGLYTQAAVIDLSKE